MAENPKERTARLLAEGLELFGRDRVDEAVARWREVLAIDPGHREARDYLESAGAALKAPGRADALAAQALALAERGDAEKALAMLRAATERTPQDLETQAAFDLLRAHQFARDHARIGGKDGRPRLKVGCEKLMNLDLPPEAGFLLSMLDGRTRIEELLTMSGLDAFEALRVLVRLQRAGIVEIAS